MSGILVPRRTQFSSCDACRLSRVACDASRFGHQPGQIEWRGSCSRCARRNLTCAFEWMGNVRKRRRGSSSPSLPDDLLREPSDMNAESADRLLSLWCQKLFTHGFETIFSLSVARHSCPFVDNPASDAFIPSVKLFSTLDAYMMTRSNSQDKSQLPLRTQQQEEIDRALDLTVKAFVARWLPLVAEQQLSSIQIDDTIRASWRSARKEMLKLANRESYRSVLALYLFSQTPIPLGISEDEELDGISALICLQSALLQVQRLRERQKSCHFPIELEGVSSWTEALASSAHTNTVTSILTTQTYLEYENRAYWAATMWDTSASLTSDYRSSLSSGLKGACSEPAWRLSRAFLVGSFQPQTASWLANGFFEINEQAISLIISAASIGGLYIWKTIASSKEALREGVEEDAVDFAFNAFLDAKDIFTTSIRPLLNHCGRQIHFLNQVHRFHWYKVNLRYYLGILVMADALEAARRSDLLARVTATTQEADYECLNTLKFGFENTYTIDSLSLSLIAIDPFSEHVTDAVKLMHKIINRRYREGNIKHETYTYLTSILVEAFQQLPQRSKITQAVREDLQRSVDGGRHETIC